MVWYIPRSIPSIFAMVLIHCWCCMSVVVFGYHPLVIGSRNMPEVVCPVLYWFLVQFMVLIEWTVFNSHISFALEATQL